MGAASDSPGHAVMLYAFDGYVPMSRGGLVELVAAGSGCPGSG